MATCECLDEDSESASFCHKWTCYETGYDYFFPNFLWILLPVSVCGLFVVCCLMCIRNDKVEGVTLVGCWYILFAVISVLIAAALSGFVAILVGAGTIFILFPSLLFFYWWSRRAHRRSKQWRVRRIAGNAPFEWWRYNEVLSGQGSSQKSGASLNKDNTCSTHVSFHASEDREITMTESELAMLPVAQAEPVPA